MRQPCNSGRIVCSILFLIGLAPGQDIRAGSVQEFSLSPAQVLSSPLFPCSNCHEGMEPNSRKRELSFHQEIKIKGHGEPQRWCLDCHDAAKRDKLRLLNGETIEIRDSYQLCGQCHGNIFKAWKAGIHGKRTGMWDGSKNYLLCTTCHNPHSPRFKPLKPEAVPLRPEETLRK